MKIYPLMRIWIAAIAFLAAVLSCTAHDWYTARTTGNGTQPVAVSLQGEPGPASAEKGLTGIGGFEPAAATSTPTFTSTTFASTNVPITIPDNNTIGITSTVAVNAPRATALAISVNIQHSYIADLVVDLISPAGVRFSIFDRGASAVRFPLTNQTVALPAGTAINGTWTLAVKDVARLDTGSLLSWSLIVSVPGSAAIDLVISLQGNPTGDNNGNSQGGVASDAQNRWERIIGFFADAVYESTEGAHRIRNVRVFRNAQNWKNADITWDNTIPPPGDTKSNRVRASGINQTGGHVYMYEIFSNGGNPLNLVTNERAGGYAMAHEWGHYFYGLYDEYVLTTGDIPVSPSIMNSQWNAINFTDGTAADLKWLNFSIKGPVQTSGAFGDFQNTYRTKQHRAYGASGWEVLARPTSSDPSDSASRTIRTLGQRNYYPELASVAPSGSPRADLTLPGSTARSQLNIIWMTDRLTTEIVIDQSGSMADESKIASARSAAKFLVDVAELGKTRIGVTAFDSSVRNIIAERDVTTQADKDAIKAAIDTIVPLGNTAIGDAAQAAIVKITTDTASIGDTRVVFLLTDGQSNVGRDPLSVIPAYNAVSVPLFTFGFGSDVDSTVLGSMARQTGAQYFFSPTTLAEISSAFRSASLLAGSKPGLQSDTMMVLSGTTVTNTIAVDSSLSRLQINVAYNAAAPGGQVQLLAPTGLVVNPSSTNLTTGETLLLYDVDQPAPGNWRINTTAVGSSRTFRYDATGVNSGVGYNLVAAVNNGSTGTTISYPSPAIITAMLSRNLPISRATGVATISDTAGSVTRLTLRDDGVFPDTVADDGNYALAFYYPHPGEYNVRIDFSNPSNLATQTQNGAESPSTAGTAMPQAPDQLVNETFTRSQTIPLSVVGSAAFSSRLVNLSILTSLPTPGDTLTMGYVVGGSGTSGAKPLVIRAAGPSLAAFGISSFMDDPKLELYTGSTKTGENDNWGGSTVLANAMTGVGAFMFANPTSLDAAATASITTASNTVKVFGAGASTGAILAELYDATPTAAFTATTPRLINVSVLKKISSGEMLTAGFVVNGLAAKTVLIRAVGPSLSSFNITGPMADPKIDLYSGTTVIASNDNWGGGGTLSAAFTTVGAFSLGATSRDAALLVTLQAGPYSAQVSGVGGSTGTALVEVYELP